MQDFIILADAASLEPTRVLDFVGKNFDTKRRRMENRKGMVTALLRSWLRLRLGPERLLGLGTAVVGLAW